MKNLNLENIEEAKDFDRVQPGGYVCGITAVEDVVRKEYLKLEYDIADGPFKNYYRNLYNSKGFWAGNFIRSYKDAALPFFKAFITSIENSNSGYHWNSDEKTLVRKFIGLVLAEEEYKANDGSIKTRLYVAKVTSVDKIRKGDFKIPALKKISELASTASTAEDNISGDDGVPF